MSGVPCRGDQEASLLPLSCFQKTLGGIGRRVWEELLLPTQNDNVVALLPIPPNAFNSISLNASTGSQQKYTKLNEIVNETLYRA